MVLSDVIVFQFSTKLRKRPALELTLDDVIDVWSGYSVGRVLSILEDVVGAGSSCDLGSMIARAIPMNSDFSWRTGR